MALGSVGSRNGLQPNPDDFARIHLTLAAVGAAPASIVVPGPRCYNTDASYATTLRQEGYRPMQWGEAARRHMTRWVDPGWLERMRRWFRPLEDTPSDVRAAIGRVECSAEQFLARVRVGIVALLGLVLAALALSAGRVNGSAVLIYAAYLALSISAWVLTRRGRFPLWLPWALTSLDVAFVLVVVRLGHYASMLPGSYVASLTITWSVFLLLALTTLRYNGWLVLYATALFVIGLGTIMALGQEHGISPVEVLPNLFLPGRNILFGCFSLPRLDLCWRWPCSEPGSRLCEP